MSKKESLPRRNFVKRASAAGIGGATLLASSPAQAGKWLSFLGKKEPFDIDRATAQDFKTYVGTTFRTYSSDGFIIDLKLIEVHDKSKGAELPPEFRKTTLLVFEGPAELEMEQGACLIDHESLGQFELFCVPNEYETSCRLVSAVLG